MALGADKINPLKTPSRYRNFPNIAAGVTIWEGAMVAIDASGNCRPARANAGDHVVGVAKKRYVTPASGAGAITGGIEVDSESLHLMKNSGSTDAITNNHVDQICYVVDDETVALSDGTGLRPVAGRIAKVDSAGVWVDFVGRGAIVAVTVRMADVSTAETVYVNAPVSGRLIKIMSVLHAAITVADSNVVAAIKPKASGSFVDVTDGALVITAASSAIGDVDEATPTALNIVAAGDPVRLTGDGGSTTTAPITFTLLFAAS